MKFYYRIYQKTKVLTRKRKKKNSTKTSNKSNPAKKRKTDAPTLDKLPHNGMEVDEELTKAPKISSKINGEGAKEVKKDSPKVNGVKEVKKDSPRVSFGGVETKPLKSVTINHNVSYSNSDRSLDKVPTTKSKPLSPILKNVSSDRVSKLPSEKVAKLPSSERPAKLPSDKVTKLPPAPTLPRSVTEPSKNKPTTTSSNVSQNSIKSSHQPSKKPVTPGTGSVSSSNKTTSGGTQMKPTSNVGNNSSVTKLETDKKTTSPPSVKGKDSLKEKSAQLPVTSSANKVVKEKSQTNGVKHPEKSVASVKTSPSEKPVTKLISDSATKKQTSDNQVVEISVEVSASDIKKVLEKKKAEKDAKLITNGEERLYSNYSIVDQLKKSNAAAAAANLANQKKQASMMDFTRSSEAFNGPKVPPNVQGLQPKSSSETNVLSAIVHSLAQKQPSLNQKIQAATSNSPDNKVNNSVKTNNKETSSVGSSKTTTTNSISKSANSDSSEKLKQSVSDAVGAKTLGTIVGSGVTTTKTAGDKPVTSMAPKLPISTSIKPITKDIQTNSTSVETSGSKGNQQIMNFLKNNTTSNSNSLSKPSTTQESAKNAESLTKNIPAGTTVTVKTVDSKQNKTSSPSSNTPTSKNSAFRMNFDKSNNFSPLGKGVSNPFSTAGDTVSQAALMNPLLQSHMAALAQQQAAAQAQYLNFSSQVAAAAALSSQLEVSNYINNTAANLVSLRAAAAQITQSPMTTLAFTKPISTPDDSRYGLKIPQPNVSRQSSPSSVSSFGTSRLQVKVNPDSPKTESKSVPSSRSESGSPSGGGAKTPTTTSSSNNPSIKPPSGIHSMPAMVSFHDMKKVQAIPKSVNNSNRSLPISSLLNKHSTKPNPISPSKSPVLSAPAPVKSSENLSGSGKNSPSNTPSFKPVTQANSLKKLVADLNSAKAKKAENLLNTLKKHSEKRLSNENQLLSESKKAFLGLDQKINEKLKEVTSS